MNAVRISLSAGYVTEFFPFAPGARRGKAAWVGADVTSLHMCGERPIAQCAFGSLQDPGVLCPPARALLPRATQKANGEAAISTEGGNPGARTRRESVHAQQAVAQAALDFQAPTSKLTNPALTRLNVHASKQASAHQGTNPNSSKLKRQLHQSSTAATHMPLQTM